MDAKLKEDLFRRYVGALERRLEDGGGKRGIGNAEDSGRHKDSEALLSTATALLGAYQPDPGQRFRMVRFYEVVEGSLRCQRGANLRSLERAFHTLETICTNLLLFPWKKEFKCIKVRLPDQGCSQGICKGQSVFVKVSQYLYRSISICSTAVYQTR